MLIFESSQLSLGLELPVIELNTTISKLYEESKKFIEKYPEIKNSIEYDLDTYALNKKKMRIENKKYFESKAVENGERLFDTTEYYSSDIKTEFTLSSGRPRSLNAELLFFFMLVRGTWGSISDQEAVDKLADSITIQSILNYHGYKVPSVNSLRENLNKIQPATYQLILEHQAWYILEEGLDDFHEIYIDSTAVKANTEFPVDIDILNKLLIRCSKSFNKLSEFGVQVELDKWTETRLEKMGKHLRFIDMNSSRGLKGKVKERYKSFLKLSEKVIESLEKFQDAVNSIWTIFDLPPAKALALDMLWEKIEQDLWDSKYVLDYTVKRIEKNEKTKMGEKISSFSDRGAAYIAKGQREPVIGYRPQIARSRNGFIPACVVPIGNAADSQMLIPTVQHVITTTGVTPELVSTDDGYASEENVKVLKEDFKISKISIGGAKGKKLTESFLWDSKEFVVARNQRSAAESGMFTLKFNHKFGRVRRRGIEAVQIELMEKVISYNFIHIRRQRRKNAKAMELLQSSIQNVA